MTQTLTGLRRFRTYTRMFSPACLVLQVEVCETGDRSDPMNPFPAMYAKKFWRDATPDDLMDIFGEEAE